MKIRPAEPNCSTSKKRRTDKYDEPNCPFSQFRYRALKKLHPGQFNIQGLFKSRIHTDSI